MQCESLEVSLLKHAPVGYDNAVSSCSAGESSFERTESAESHQPAVGERKEEQTRRSHR